MPGKEATNVDNVSHNVLCRVNHRAEGGECRHRGSNCRGLHNSPVAESTLKVTSRRCGRAEDAFEPKIGRTALGTKVRLYKS